MKCLKCSKRGGCPLVCDQYEEDQEANSPASVAERISHQAPAETVQEKAPEATEASTSGITDPILSLDQFYERSAKLNEVFQHNLRSLTMDAQRKQHKLFMRLTVADREEVVKREQERMKELASKIVRVPSIVSPGHA